MKKNAPVLEPEPWPPELTHGLIRKAFGNSIEDVEREKIRRQAFTDARVSHGYTERRLDDLEKNIQAFESVSGIQIGSWVDEERVRDQAELLKVLLRDGLDGHRRRARRLAGQLEKIGQDLRSALGDEV